MAAFEIANKKSMNFEGGYVNDPDDPGAETYKGISRRYHPEVTIWPIIDGMKAQNIGTVLTDELKGIIHAWYKVWHWDFFGMDFINDQRIANEIYDSGINLGRRTVGKFVQECSNTHFDESQILKVDGYPGPRTQSNLAKIIVMGPARIDTLYKQLNSEQGHHYTMAANKNPRLKKFVVGWYKRVYEEA